jgi:hypothetical protein
MTDPGQHIFACLFDDIRLENKLSWHIVIVSKDISKKHDNRVTVLSIKQCAKVSNDLGGCHIAAYVRVDRGPEPGDTLNAQFNKLWELLHFVEYKIDEIGLKQQKAEVFFLVQIWIVNPIW